MHTLTTAVRRSLSEGKAAASERFREHSTLLTVFAVAMIVITGVGVAEGREEWWLSAIALTVVFALVFIFLNARVLIKAAIATVMAVLTANFALQAGAMLSPAGSIGLVWMTVQLFLFFALLAYSYAATGYKSRWTGLTLSLPLALTTGIVAVTLMPPFWALLSTVAVGFGFFVFYFKAPALLGGARKAMPPVEATPAVERALIEAAEQGGWELRTLTKGWGKRAKPAAYLLWRDSHAFVLAPVKLTTKFGVAVTRRGTQLMYRGRPINGWLLRLVNGLLPLWRTKNASMMLVLLDVTSANGSKAEAIGVAVPDSKRRIPVGVFPAEKLLRGKDAHALDRLEGRYSSYLTPLSPRQEQALAKLPGAPATE